MIFQDILHSDIFSWVVLPILIFLSRILDQSIGTMRLIYVSKGFKKIVPFLGFFEVMIWLLAISQIIKHLDNFMCYVAYGIGFATGNYVGMLLEERMSIGNVIVRIIPKHDVSNLIEHLRAEDYALTIIDAEGKEGKVKMIFSIVNRKNLNNFINILNTHNPTAFYTVEDVRMVCEGHVKSPQPKKNRILSVFYPFIKKVV